MAEEPVNPISQFEAPYGREITLQDVTHDSGLKVMRMRIREGARFTILDIDQPTAAQWSALMADWAAPD
mgnify:FL=1